MKRVTSVLIFCKYHPYLAYLELRGLRGLQGSSNSTLRSTGLCNNCFRVIYNNPHEGSFFKKRKKLLASESNDFIS